MQPAMQMKGPPDAGAARLVEIRRRQQDQVVHIHGRVVDPDGKAVAGAKVNAVPMPAEGEMLLQPVALARTTSGVDGRFELTFRQPPDLPRNPADGPAVAGPGPSSLIVASAKGFGIAWKEPAAADAKGDLTLTLAADLPIDGRVLDLEGRPVKGVNVIVDSVGPVHLNPGAPEPAGQYLPYARHAEGRPEAIVTDAMGRFRITGLGREREVHLQLIGRRVGFTRIAVITRVMKPMVENVGQVVVGRVQIVTYGAKFDYLAAPGRPVVGVAKDARTHEPMAGVQVRSTALGLAPAADAGGVLYCTTDEKGRFRLEGMPKQSGNLIVAVPGDAQPYFTRIVAVKDATGLGPVTADIELHRGVWVAGKITDKKTGQPLSVRLAYSTYLTNKHTLGLPEFDRGVGPGVVPMPPGGYRSAPDGSYRLVAPPGKIILAATGSSEDYRRGVGSEKIEAYKDNPNPVGQLYQPIPQPKVANAIAEIQVPDDAQTVRADLQLDPGESIHVAIIDPESKPLSGVYVRGNKPEFVPMASGSFVTRLEDASFDAVGFGPDDVRSLLLRDDERGLGKALFVRLDDVPNRRLTVRLLPLAVVTARLTDPGGHPFVGLSVQAAIRDKLAGDMMLPAVKTDAAGRFRYTLMPGWDYSIEASGPEVNGTVVVAFSFYADPGSTRDLGDVRI